MEEEEEEDFKPVTELIPVFNLDKLELSILIQTDKLPRFFFFASLVAIKDGFNVHASTFVQGEFHYRAKCMWPATQYSHMSMLLQNHRPHSAAITCFIPYSGFMVCTRCLDLAVDICTHLVVRASVRYDI